MFVLRQLLAVMRQWPLQVNDRRYGGYSLVTCSIDLQAPASLQQCFIDCPTHCIQHHRSARTMTFMYDWVTENNRPTGLAGSKFVDERCFIDTVSLRTSKSPLRELYDTAYSYI